VRRPRGPEERRGRWLAPAASLAAHALLLGALALTVHHTGSVPVTVTRMIELAPPAAGRAVRLPVIGGVRPLRTGTARRGAGASSAAPVAAPPQLPPVARAPVRIAAPALGTPRGTDSAGVFGIVAPGLGHAKLWVEPLPLEPKALAAALSSGDQRLADSAITVIIQHYLDSIAAAPDRDRGPPSWTTTVVGTKFGLDSKNIYLAGLKIPTAVLALLKLPGANESKVFDRSVGLMQDDLRRAAARANTLEEFRESVRELRAEREREHEMQENQKRSPSDTASLRPAGKP
jgi:hypothetical protein